MNLNAEVSFSYLDRPLKVFEGLLKALKGRYSYFEFLTFKYCFKIRV